MDLREVREAASRLHNGWHSQSQVLLGDYETVCDYVLATIDPSPDEPITEQWLQEEWGFEEIGDKFYLDHDYSHYLIILKDGIGVFYFDCDDGDLWPHDLHTRQQFCDLARCLGIPRRKDGAK